MGTPQLMREGWVEEWWAKAACQFDLGKYCYSRPRLSTPGGGCSERTPRAGAPASASPSTARAREGRSSLDERRPVCHRNAPPARDPAAVDLFPRLPCRPFPRAHRLAPAVNVPPDAAARFQLSELVFRIGLIAIRRRKKNSRSPWSPKRTDVTGPSCSSAPACSPSVHTTSSTCPGTYSAPTSPANLSLPSPRGAIASDRPTPPFPCL